MVAKLFIVSGVFSSVPFPALKFDVSGCIRPQVVCIRIDAVDADFPNPCSQNFKRDASLGTQDFNHEAMWTKGTIKGTFPYRFNKNPAPAASLKLLENDLLYFVLEIHFSHLIFPCLCYSLAFVSHWVNWFTQFFQK